MHETLITDEYHSLLKKFSGYIRRAGFVDAASIALRTRSERFRDVIAYVATWDRLTTDEIRQASLVGELSELSFRYVWLATLGRVCALQAFQTEDELSANEDIEFGLACLQTANKQLPRDDMHKQFHRLEVELLMRAGRLREARELIATNSYLEEYYYGYLLADVSNPHLSNGASSFEEWLERFNRPFVANGLQPLQVSSTIPLFNDLRTDAVMPRREGPKVSVILTCYKPETPDFVLAVESILNQSWKNLELIVVDDASPENYDEVLHNVTNIDPRIQLIKLAENGGTYRARNVGLQIATGEFITGQDSDDWSHPERIALQVEYLMSDGASCGSVVEAIRMDDQLLRTFPGRLPDALCEVSLMVPLDLVKRVGGYIDARKGADSEFRLRLEHLTAQQVHGIRKPLYLTRLSSDSLSRADFKPGWSHPVRRAFWNASRYWHENAKTSQLCRTSEEWSPFPIPNVFKVSPLERATRLDVVFVGDWRTYGRTQRAMIDAAEVHLQDGQRVGIMHLESVLSPSKGTTRLAPEVQKLINGGLVTEVLPDDNVAADLAIVRDPVTLQFAATNGPKLECATILIVPDRPPVSAVSEGVLYSPKVCSATAEMIFGGQVWWSSEDPAINKSVMEFDHTIPLLSEALPLVFNVNRWANGRPRLSSSTLRVGRHSENYEEVWPADFKDIERLWPTDGSVDVRMLGDIRALLRKFDSETQPRGWLAFHDQEIKPEAFMSGLDLFVYFPQDGFEQRYAREALEACASGALVLLPRHFEEIHGETAIYGEAAEVPRLLEKIRQNSRIFFKATQKQRAALVSITDNSSYLEFTRDLNSFGGVAVRLLEETRETK